MSDRRRERLRESDLGEILRRGDRAGESRAGLRLLERLGDGDAMMDGFDA